MDDAFELAEFLPVAYKTRSEEEYMAFLWSAFDSNYTNGKYEFSSLAFHLLYMSFISFSVWQIRLARERDFGNALVGFLREAEGTLLKADTPFKFYEKLKESQIFRFLKLVGCGNDQVGEFAKFVRRRNRIAHPSGTVFFNDQDSIDDELGQMMREVGKIQQHMKPVVVEIYERFLVESSDIELREYADAQQELEVGLIHRHYMSKRDIDICLAQGPINLAGHEQYDGIQELHNELIAEYASD